MTTFAKRTFDAANYLRYRPSKLECTKFRMANALQTVCTKEDHILKCFGHQPIRHP